VAGICEIGSGVSEVMAIESKQMQFCRPNALVACLELIMV
jgi:hypothetical protein